MISPIFEIIAKFIINLIETTNYFGIFLAMTIESALIPLPSEIIMPFSGYLVSLGKLNLFLVSLTGAVGNLVGSLLAYWLGFWGHERVVRRIIRKFGKWILLTEKDLDRSELFLRKHGDVVVLVSRVLPAIRTIISLPAGIARLPLLRFSILTFIGSFIWSLFLTYVGVVLGENWHILGPIFRKFDLLIAILIVVVIAYYLYFKYKEIKGDKVRKDI